ncbi:sister chromatid cohesion protein PDS5 homolog C-like isoform X2 [Impatiens glandulifera]|uniref:sister chromatid cohesion protein PDS5 homolog C-like isoform X2 n=1 Tax=Impatiens glandulifera TaxID=253017 RepID=UPI001FB05C79|nr:sister chromatid cohesion protein PDS5 homolog C-like isoform X2 [Impatiens glandulifera]
MTSSGEKLGDQLVKAGNNLLPPPTSVDELLEKLDHIEALLIEVEQSPPKSMLDAIIPSMKSLVANELIKHSDIDVKVAVACCISEITRITAPEAPYDDEKMKEVFELIVSSFENLSDKSSRSYTKRTSILETVAKVRSCVIMLDLECEWLIADMFQHFLKTIRDYHPENVFSAMMAIMVLVLEESEDVSLELLSPVLAILKKDNQEILLEARKLAEKVFESCAAKIKPCLVQAVETEALSLDEYSNVVAGICGITCVKENGVQAENDGPACGEPPAVEETLVEPSSHDVPQVEENILVESSTNDIPQDDERAVASAPSDNLVPDETVDDEPIKDAVPDGSPQAAKINDSSKDNSEGPSAGHEELVDTNENTAVISLTPDITKEVQIELQPEQSMKIITNMSEDGQHTDKKSDDKKSDPNEAINAEPEDGQHSEQLDNNNMESKAGSNDLGSTTVVKLKLKSEETTEKGSKKPEDDAQETDQVTENNEIEPADLESSKIVKSSSKSELTGRKRSKKPDDVNEAGKAESGDLGNIKVFKLKFKTEETARGSSKTPDEGQDTDQLIDTNEATKAESVELNNTKVIKPESKSGQTTTSRKRRRKLNSFSTREPSGSSFVDDGEKEAGKLSELIDHNEEVPCPPSQQAKLSRNTQKNEQLASPSQSETLLDENQPKKSAQVNKKLKQGVEGPSDSEVRNKKQSGKRVSVKDTTESKSTPVVGGQGRKTTTIDKKGTSSNTDISSLKRKSGGKSGQVKSNSDKDMTSKSSSKADKKDLQISPKRYNKLLDDESEDHMVEETPKIKSKTKRNSGKDKETQHPTKPSSTSPEDMDYSEETPKISSKRKRSGKDEASGDIKYNDSLVGSKVKVWWPDDAQFYFGVIDSFDSVKKKHKVLYDDGDEETLILKKERWEFVEDESKTLMEEEDEYQSSEGLSGMLQKKKSKTAEKTPKQGKTDSSRGKKPLPKSKVTATKSGKKSSEDEEDTDEGKTTESKSLKSDDSDSDRPKVISQKTVKKPIGSNSKSKNEGSWSKSNSKSKLEKKFKGKTPPPDDSEKENNTSDEEDEEEETAKKLPEIEVKQVSGKKGKSTGKDEKKESVEEKISGGVKKGKSSPVETSKSGGASSKRMKKRKRY